MSSFIPDLPLYQNKRVRITRALLEINKEVYQIRHFDSIKIISQRPNAQEPRMSITVGILILLAASIINEPFILLSLGLFVIIVGCLWLNSLKTIYVLMIKTIGGQDVIYQSRELDEIQTIKSCLESILENPS